MRVSTNPWSTVSLLILLMRYDTIRWFIKRLMISQWFFLSFLINVYH